MPDLTDVLHRATDDLSPTAPDDLLSGALSRGGRLRRRRQAVRAAGGGSALVAAVVCGVVAIGAQSGGPVREAPADPVSTLSDSPSVTPHTQLAVDRSQIGATFAQVVPGTISDEHDVPAGRVHSRGAYESEFDWNGFRVSVMLTPFDGDARHACERTLDRQVASTRCVRMPGAWVVRDDTMGEQSYHRSANVFRDDGWQAWVLIYNSGDEKGSSSAGAPPLDVADLERVATSDLWVG
jgi:hypothetical protein